MFFYLTLDLTNRNPTAVPQRSGVTPTMEERKLSMKEVKPFVWILPGQAQEGTVQSPNLGALPPITMMLPSKIAL